MFIHIYTLSDPRLPARIRYVGWTINPKRRLREHVSRAQYHREDTHKARWIRGLLSIGIKPDLITIEQTDELHVQERERYWISYYRTLGFPLTNLSEGGDGVLGYHHTPEIIEKYSSKLRGRPKSPAHRKNISIARTGSKASLETRTQMSITRRGRRMPASAIEKTSAFHRGRKRSESTKAKLRAAWVLRRAKLERKFDRNQR